MSTPLRLERSPLEIENGRATVDGRRSNISGISPRFGCEASFAFVQREERRGEEGRGGEGERKEKKSKWEASRRSELEGCEEGQWRLVQPRLGEALFFETSSPPAQIKQPLQQLFIASLLHRFNALLFFCHQQLRVRIAIATRANCAAPHCCSTVSSALPLLSQIPL